MKRFAPDADAPQTQDALADMLHRLAPDEHARTGQGPGRMELGDNGLEHQVNARAARDARADARPDHAQTGSWGGSRWPHGALPCQLL